MSGRMWISLVRFSPFNPFTRRQSPRHVNLTGLLWSYCTSRAGDLWKRYKVVDRDTGPFDVLLGKILR